jgi:aldehyde dehydrogenase
MQQTQAPNVDAALVTEVVNEVLRRLGSAAPQAAAASGNGRLGSGSHAGTHGVFNCVDAAVEAAAHAQRQLNELSLEQRGVVIECIRNVMRRDKQELGRIEFEETKIGKLAHKVEKLDVAASVPGIEMLRTEATSGDHGLTVTEYTPWGVVGIVTPVTHSVPTLGCNAIMILSAGNALVCNPHPAGTRCAVEATRRWNREIQAKTGIDNLICIMEQPTLESAEQIFKHPGIPLLLVTGGPGVAKAAMASGKRAIAAGPGNPPVVVDDTADLDKAAQGIIAGAAYDNNLLCIGEKEVFVVRSVAEQLMDALARHGGYRLPKDQMDELARKTIEQDPNTGHYHAKKEFVGRDAAEIGELLGPGVPPNTQLLFGEVDESNPYLPCEQMMPVLPILVVPDVDTAIAKAVHFEHGFKHTAICWSRNVDVLTRMGKAVDTTLYVKNGPSVAGLGVGGQGYGSFSIATPTGEGVTSPLSFTRYRRCTMVDNLRIF